MSQAPLQPPPGQPTPGRTSRPFTSSRGRAERAPSKGALAVVQPLKTAKPNPWNINPKHALIFVVGLSLGYGLAAPARNLGHLLATLGHGPKAVGAILAPQQSEEPILVLGSDQVSGSTDVMFTVRVGDGLTRVIQVPRDTFVETPSLGVQKVNALYATAGIEATRKEVGRLVGTPVEKYLKVNLRAVERVAEALGGVDVNVPKRMYYVDNAQGLYIDLYPGRQTLKGRELEGFLRFRHDEEGDLGRMDRQRLVINEMFRKLVRPATLVQLPALMKIAGEDIDTNLSPLDLSRVIGLMGQSKLSSQRLPGRLYWQDDLSYWMPDSNKDHPLENASAPN
jgi:LCP family protein required for cell wall assembly